MEDPFDRKSDVYAKLVLHPWLLSVKTAIVPNIVSNAAWDQTLYIAIDHNIKPPAGAKALLVQLWDSDIGANILLSDSTVSLEDIMKNPGEVYSVESDLM
jgi:hypothetical protein